LCTELREPTYPASTVEAHKKRAALAALKIQMDTFHGRLKACEVAFKSVLASDVMEDVEAWCGENPLLGFEFGYSSSSDSSETEADE
jgi:hypothetical protein